MSSTVHVCVCLCMSMMGRKEYFLLCFFDTSEQEFCSSGVLIAGRVSSDPVDAHQVCPRTGMSVHTIFVCYANFPNLLALRSAQRNTGLGSLSHAVLLHACWITLLVIIPPEICYFLQAFKMGIKEFC